MLQPSGGCPGVASQRVGYGRISLRILPSPSIDEQFFPLVSDDGLGKIGGMMFDEELIMGSFVGSREQELGPYIFVSIKLTIVNKKVPGAGQDAEIV
ncbi:hypothetical protein AFLA_000090 [Aspergillus flavus NRRL3357]|nr:hypothetical protein AFLA_000090 [Aspergillus flavus NRRL3357]